MAIQWITKPANKLKPEDWKKWGMNLLYFSAPILVIFFGLLAQGVTIEKAWPVALLSLYGALADLFKKYKSVSAYEK